MGAKIRSQTINHFPNIKKFKSLSSRPNFAWPTVLLLVAAIFLFAIGIITYLQNSINLPIAVTLNTIASYMAFTVMHDASHNSLSRNKQFNDWCGRIATWMLLPAPFFRMFRYVHMQHHRFVNDESKDPDHYASRGSKWLLPFRWATQDIYYFFCYLDPKVFKKRPASEKREFIIASIIGVALLSLIVIQGWTINFLLLFVLPSRIATLILVFGFDYLPHHPHTKSDVKKPYQAAQNRIGLEWIMTPLFLGQNYHLVHHLYPTVPFYRYVALWHSNIEFHNSQKPAQTSIFKLS